MSASRSGGEPAPETLIVVILHGLALAVAAAALLLELSLPAGSIGAIAGTVVAVFVAGRLARSRLRLSTVWIAAALTTLLGLALSSWLVEGSLGPRLFGAGGAMALSDVVRFALLATAIALALRTTTARWAPFASAELALVALALASVVAAHRDGAINHPRALSDWAWTTGRDPVKILLWFGAGTLIALAVAMLREQRGRGGRVALHLGAVAGLAALVMMLISFVGLPPAPRGEGLGKGGKSDEKDKKNGGKGGGKPDDKDSKGGKGQPGDDNSDGQGGHPPGQQGGGKDTRDGSGKGNQQNQMDDIEFKNDYSSSSQDSPVAVILLHDDYSPPLGYYYFRQTAFSQYNGHRLIARTRDDVDMDILVDFPTSPTKVADPPRTGPERKVFDSTVALLADHIHPFGLETPIEFAPRESPDPSRFTRAYTVTSAALAMRYEELLGRKSFGSGWSKEQKAAYTDFPDDPRYKQLADLIVNTTLREEYRNDPFAQAIAVSGWLSKNSAYSRKSQHADKGDPTADFLFGDRIGYCVHFAHAAAFLLRARGLPSRIAGGYAADEGRKGSGSTIMLRQKDAHAWAELHLDGFGWIIVDVAPARNLDPPDTPPDQDLQRMLGEMARQQKPLPKEAKPDDLKLPSLEQVVRATGSLLLAALLLAYSIKLWRRLIADFVGARGVYRLAYRAALDALGEIGWQREEGETREHFATRVGAVAPSLFHMTAQHVGAAYGARRLVSPEEMRALARRTAEEAQRGVPWWRLVLGILNPISWISTR